MSTDLFVCAHKAERSLIAEVFFNQLEKGKYKAMSAGITLG